MTCCTVQDLREPGYRQYGAVKVECHVGTDSLVTPTRVADAEAHGTTLKGQGAPVMKRLRPDAGCNIWPRHEQNQFIAIYNVCEPLLQPPRMHCRLGFGLGAKSLEYAAIGHSTGD